MQKEGKTRLRPDASQGMSEDIKDLGVASGSLYCAVLSPEKGM